MGSREKEGAVDNRTPMSVILSDKEGNLTVILHVRMLDDMKMYQQGIRKPLTQVFQDIFGMRERISDAEKCQRRKTETFDLSLVSTRLACILTLVSWIQVR